MTAAEEAQPRLSIGQVIRRTIDVLQRNWRALLRPALLYLYLPGAVVGVLQVSAAGNPGAEAATGLLALLALIPYVMLQGGLYRLTIADLRAEAVSTEEALAEGRQRVWALIGLVLLSGLAIGVGLVLLIIPGVLLALAWAVVGPALIVERRGIMESFGRSAWLTRRTRLQILGLGLVFVLLELLGALAFGLVSLPFPPVLSAALIWPAYSSACIAIASVGVGVLFEELRTLKEGDAAATPAP